MFRKKFNRRYGLRTAFQPRSARYLAAIGLALLSLIGSGASQQSPKGSADQAYEVSGFLGNYAGMYPANNDRNLLLYVKEKGILRNYTKFIVEPVAIQLTPEGDARNIDPDVLRALAYDCREALIAELKKSNRYQVVTQPGPGVLRLRAALTDVAPTRNKANAAASVGVAAASATVAPGAGLVMPRLSVGHATIEVEMLDSQSGERMVAVITSKGGRRFFSGLQGMKKWGDVEKAFKQWAKAFRKQLDGSRQLPA